MTGINLVIVILNLCEIAVGIVVLVWCALRDDPRRRFMWGAIASLSTVYALGYGWLLSGADIVTWSNTLRGVSLLAWPVWFVPALIVTRQHLKDLRTVRAELQGDQ